MMIKSFRGGMREMIELYKNEYGDSIRVRCFKVIKGIRIIIPKLLDIRKLSNGDYEVYFKEAI